MIEVSINDIEEAKARITAEKERKIRFCDYVKLKKQLEQIEYEMTHNYKYFFEKSLYQLHITSKPPIPYFQLYCCECGVGKTYTIINKILNFLEEYCIYDENSYYKDENGNIKGIINNRNKGMLFVMQNIKTLTAYKMRLYYLLNENIYAEVIDSSMKDEEINFKLQKYPIIFITHQMYKSLAENEIKRKRFSKNRILLIIDEFVNMCDIVNIDKVKLEKLRADIKYIDIQEKFDKVVMELKKYFQNLQTNGKDRDKHLHIFNAKTKYKQILNQVKEIKKEISNTFSDKEKSSFYNEHNKSIYNAIDDVTEFFRGTCILEKGVLYTPKRSNDYWFLEKNLVLDASARINNVYKLRKKQFQDMLEKNFQVLDHKNWTIEIIEVNTKASSKNNYDNFFKICNQKLKELGKEVTLVVTQKSECIDSKGNRLIDYFDTPFLNYFQNMLGDNNYKHLQNVLIAHTFNLSEKQYILEYLYYSNKKFNSDDDIKVVLLNERRTFVNKNIEEYKIGRIANEFYQAVKRVNRDMDKETRVVILTKEVEAVELVCKMLKNCKIIDTTNNYKIKYKKFEYENSSLGYKDYDIKAIKIFQDILNNNMKGLSNIIKDHLKYEDNKVILSKKALRTELEIEYAPNLKRDVFNKSNVKRFIRENEIIVETKRIIFKCKK